MARKSKKAVVESVELKTFVNDVEFVVDGYRFDTVNGDSSMSAQIRDLVGIGERMSVVANWLGVRYQFVNNVVAKQGRTPSQLRRAGVNSGVWNSSSGPVLWVTCKCCGVALTHPKSVSQGVGPVCVGHWKEPIGAYEHIEGEDD